MQLALFRDLRQARRQAAEQTAQLAQAHKAAEQQRREHDQERQALQASEAAARQKNAQLDTALSEATAIAAAKAEADTQEADRLVAEQHRATARITELERAACTAAAAHQAVVKQLQDTLDDTQRQLAAVDAARMAADQRSQSLHAVQEELDAEKRRNSALLEKLLVLWTSTNAASEEYERELTEERQRTATARQQTDELRCSLVEATTTLRQERDQLDKTALSLSRWRAAREPQVYTAKIEKLSADLGAAHKELASRTEERDLARANTFAALKALLAAGQRIAAVEQELREQKELVEKQHALVAEVMANSDKVYAQLMGSKKRRD